MFSGITAYTKKISAIDLVASKHRLQIDIGADTRLLTMGDSVAVNGVCLTVVELVDSKASFDVIPQTLATTNLKIFGVGDDVNIELSLTYGAAIGGHMVQGHVDTTLNIEEITINGEEWQVWFSLPQAHTNHIVEKGFVTLDGMSLTVQQRTKDNFMVALIPHTRQVSIAKNYQVNSVINFEADMMAKYICQYYVRKTKVC
jgi:riboflavin synthase